MAEASHLRHHLQEFQIQSVRHNSPQWWLIECHHHEAMFENLYIRGTPQDNGAKEQKTRTINNYGNTQKKHDTVDKSVASFYFLACSSACISKGKTSNATHQKRREEIREFGSRVRTQSK